MFKEIDNKDPLDLCTFLGVKENFPFTIEFDNGSIIRGKIKDNKLFELDAPSNNPNSENYKLREIYISRFTNPYKVINHIPKLNNKEMEFLSFVHPKYKYITKDKDGSVYCSEYEPYKHDEKMWDVLAGNIALIKDHTANFMYLPEITFDGISWYDETPLNFREYISTHYNNKK